ncbi:MAG: hypothetical protein ACOXZ4_06570 [Sphaerochaetaceae bacterium]
MVQEVAGSHAHHIGVSIPQLQKQNKTWVVTRTRMNIFAYASWPANLSFRTLASNPLETLFPSHLPRSGPKMGTFFLNRFPSGLWSTLIPSAR